MADWSAEVNVREVDAGSLMVGSSSIESKRRIKEMKRERKKRRSQQAPSNAPLESQESCVVC